MSSYQVLARRFRPQRFDDLVGQEVVVRSLRNALGSGQVAHAYLFSGLRGVGKTTAARLLAKALNCAQGPTAEPCGECDACREIAAGSALDVLEMDAASNRGIDDVRELRDVARVLPVRDRYRVFIVDEAHQLTDAAFNALLKILEEPPAHVVFVLASTEKDKFPATILSRCQQLDFRPIAADAIAARLEEVARAEAFTLEPDAARLLARAAEGSLRDGLSLLDRVRAFAAGVVDEAAVAEVLGLPPQEVLLALWRALAAGDAASAVSLVREQDGVGRDTRALYDGLVGLLEALLLLATDREAAVPFTAAREELAGQAEEIGLPMLLRLTNLALEQRALINGAERTALAVAVAVGRLALWPRLRRVEAMLAGEQQATAPTAPRPAASRPVPSNRSPAAAPTGSPATRLAAALEQAGEPLLAGRVRAAREVRAEGGETVLIFIGAANGTVDSLRAASAQIAAAAVTAGLPARVRIETQADSAGGLKQRVESDEAVRRVLEVFGGRLEGIEET